MTFNEINKLPLVVAIQRGNTKMWILGEIIFRGYVQIGEITATTP